MTTTWIIQRNLGNTSSTRQRLLAACAAEGLPVVEVPVIPFAQEMPDLPEIPFPFVFYGYTTLILHAYRSEKWRDGVFFDPNVFRPSVSLQRYGELCLNSDMETCTFAELAARSFPSERRLFIRPDDDLKQFTGQIMCRQDCSQRIALSGEPIYLCIRVEKEMAGREFRRFCDSLIFIV